MNEQRAQGGAGAVRTEPSGVLAPEDISADYDPFTSTNPTVIVYDVDLDVFEDAWRDRGTRCPQCGAGHPAERGASSVDGRRWVRFTCGDVISQEQTAG